MTVLDEVSELELSIFSRQLKMKPTKDYDSRVIVEISNIFVSKGMEEETKRGGKSSSGSLGSENEARGKQVATLDSSSGRVLPGESITWTFSLSDTRIPQSGH